MPTSPDTNGPESLFTTSATGRVGLASVAAVNDPADSSLNNGEERPRSLSSIALPKTRISRAKRSFNARRLVLPDPTRLLQGDVAPAVGDMVLARVVEIGHHAKLQTPSGRRTEMYVDDEIIVAYGDRYAPNQWEARMPTDLGECHLAAAGGLASRVTVAHPRMNEPTVIQPIGILADPRGQRLNLRQLGLPDPGQLSRVPATIVVLGTSMDSGKTSSVAAIANGLTKAGLRVGVAKVTGTGACGDLMRFEDAGATEVFDFVDAGLPTTYLQPLSEVQRVVRTLLGTLTNRGVDAIVVEVADGLLQTETAQLLATSTFHDLGVGIVFAARDALSAIEGERRLLEQGYDVRAISGVLSSSPLSCTEAASVSKAPILGLEQLSTPSIAMGLARLDQPRSALSQ